MPAPRVSLSPQQFIRERLVLAPLPFRPDISLYRPAPKSGLIGWLAAQGRADEPPYWAYAWAGGAVLALHLVNYPELVANRTVLDFGAGGGLVAIAAAKAGATVTAFEPDPIGRAAIALNAEANGVSLAISDAIVEAEVVLAGDVFYDAEVAAATLPTLTRLAAQGRRILVGDPFRRDLPLDQLELIAEYRVPDFGSDAPVRSGVFAPKLPKP
ncbi:class I SAM-dependent methyltransferase [Devosia aurantiaca]|uniref:class I SAM-dependent methyltransferase n=1 Tax=Devosia aurantiaca TaxID=2714858 RepID=UPI002E2E4D25|nr:methyltransferase domain-containing protein [Devosia aurantiaca]